MSKLPRSLPKIAVNLIPQDPFMESIVGRFLVWSLSIGRYIIILTELVVILSFLSRFKLDRDLTDVNEAIASQKVLINSYGSLETNFLSAQARIDFIKKDSQTNQVSTSLDFLEKNLPMDVKLTQLSIRSFSWLISASAISAQSMKATVDQVVKANPQSEVTLSKVKLNSQLGVIDFDVKVDQKPTVSQKSTTSPVADESGI